MSGIWLPGFERIQGQRSGKLPRAEGPAKGVAHSDEVQANTKSLATNHPWPPQLWVNPFTREKYQLISLDRTGYALKASPRTETNHMGNVIQVEIAGFAKDAHLWDEDIYQWLADELFLPVWEHAGVPLTAFQDDGLPSIESYGRHAPSRMSVAKWQTFTGWCTHQNVPDNAHWDLGRFRLGYALSLTQEDDMAVHNVIGKDRDGRWWWFKSTSSQGVEITQGTADFWYQVDESYFTGDPTLIEHLKSASALTKGGS